MKALPPCTPNNPLDDLIKRAASQTTDETVRVWLQRLLGGQFATSQDVDGEHKNLPRLVQQKEDQP